MSNAMKITISENMVTLSQIFDRIMKSLRLASDGERSEIIASIKSLLSCDVVGSADEFHNTATHLAINNNLDLAVLLLQKGIEKYPHNIDLYADLLNFLTDLGDYHNAELAQEMLFVQFPNYDTWNWRAYTYVLNYLIEFKPDNYFDSCNDIIKEFRCFLPYDERSYMAEYNLLRAINKNTEAIEILETAIKNLVVAPQCALKLSDEYLDRGEYEKTIAACNKAAYCSAESQPSVKVSYIFYNRALAKDAIVNQSLASDGQVTIEDVISAIKDYSLSIQLKLNPTTASNAKDRIRILKTLFDVDYEEKYIDAPVKDISIEDIDLDKMMREIDEKIKELEAEE